MRIQADIPDGWLRIDYAAEQVTAVNPCWTIFCSSPRSHLAIDVPDLSGPIARSLWKNYDWKKSAKEEFAEKQFASVIARSFSSGLGQVECLEARKAPNLSEVRCYEVTSAMMADFSGVTGDVEKFYNTVASARIGTRSGR